MNSRISHSPHFASSRAWLRGLGLALVFTLGQAVAHAETSAAPAEMVVPKSVFVDDASLGKDPFFPKSDRRQKTQAQAVGTNTVVQPTTILSQLKLNGFSNAKNHRLALINGTTFESGELAEVKIGARLVKVRCREIRENSVLVSVEGMNETKELQLRKGI